MKTVEEKNLFDRKETDKHSIGRSKEVGNEHFREIHQSGKACFVCSFKEKNEDKTKIREQDIYQRGQLTPYWNH